MFLVLFPALQEYQSRCNSEGFVCGKCPVVESSGNDRTATKNSREEKLPPRGEDCQPQ